MKVYRAFEKVLIVGLLCVCSWTAGSAQESSSSASVSRSRAIVNAGPNMPAPTTTYHPPNTSYPTSPPYSTYASPAPVFRIPDEVAVEEFVNYHKHRLPLPKSGQAVAMDTRLG